MLCQEISVKDPKTRRVVVKEFIFLVNTVTMRYNTIYQTYNASFHGSMNGILQLILCDIFLIFAPNIDCRDAR